MRQTPKQKLKAHLEERHPAYRVRSWKIPARPTMKDLQDAHAREHHRLVLTHHHGPSRGAYDRPLGWKTGEDVQER